MYYTQITLNPCSKHTVRILDDVYKQHKFIMWGFRDFKPDELGRVLYRIEATDDGGLSAIVQSIVRPAYAVDFPHKGVIVATKTKEVLFRGKAEPEFNDGTAYYFRLRANTVVTREGRRIGLIHEEALREWFERSFQEIGVSLKGYDVTDEGYTRGDRNGKSMIFKIARYEGVLLVNDKEKFSKAFVGGFGHAKGFGCGLISLARV